MKNYICLLFLEVGFFACKTVKQPIAPSDISGTYNQSDDRSNELVLNPNSSFLYWLPDSYLGAEHGCCDTIAYGKWAFEPNNMITLSSPAKELQNLDINVQESKYEYQDTVYISVQNPLEQYLSKKDVSPREVYYTAGIMVEGEQSFLRQITETHTFSVLKFYNPKKLPLQTIHIVAYLVPAYPPIFPPPNFIDGPKIARTKTYDVKSAGSNRFSVYIPDLTVQYFQIRHLNRDFVKIVNDHQLEWDGHIFIKKTNSNHLTNK